MLTFYIILFICGALINSNSALSIPNQSIRPVTASRSLFDLDTWFNSFWEITSSFGFSFSDRDKEHVEVLIDKVQLCRRHCKCGQTNVRNARLLGGTDLAPFEYPWLVLVQTYGLATVPGTLINDRYVLTAASSLKNLTPYDLKVMVGLHDICSPDTTSHVHSVLSIQIHPDYTQRTRQNDIALVGLAIPLKFTAYVAPICLPKSMRDSADPRRYVSNVALVTSWLKSTLAKNLSLSDTSCLPRKVGLPVLDVATCSEAAARTQGCLGVVGAPSLLCRGDAGAGVVVRSARKQQPSHVLLGVLSDRQHCEGGGRKPDGVVEWEQLKSFHGLTVPMYTRVSAHLAWIVRSTRDACYCGR